MTEQQAKELILIFKEMSEEISCIRLEMQKQREEIEGIKNVLSRMSRMM